ncbi:Ted1p [Sugiyamaella lignohabitans]|uniref:Ted1p n=1 Tax=Sugiyamaella lignohabitans TaxID=796027 RepID=A0A170QYV8_9ASCO|nr:Ted1p [Sugiyamaella lignohabitans]ANB15994.1 Ted1p [Sugiyamaella lignohabitans]
MGDLISSQWIGDEEFYRRADRYKSRIFTHNSYSQNEPVFINISGNHDVGYNGEMTYERVNRYEQIYGKMNYVVETPATNDHPSWRFVVINSLSLDGPALEPKFQQDTLQFIESISESNFNGPTVLFSHVPLYKEEGICRDSTYFNYYSWGTLREQNHLSQESSQLLLNSVFKPGNPYGGVILTGHDHEGCITDYLYNTETEEWLSTPAVSRKAASPSVREITVRSMMGEYGGNGGLLTGHFDANSATWYFYFNLCSLGVQHIWWATKITTYISIALTTLWIILTFVN